MTTEQDQFRAAIEQSGLTAPEFIRADGKLHRFSSDGSRGDDAGWYVFHSDDIPAGAFGCWRADVSKNWHADIGRRLTAEEKTTLKRRAAEDKQKQEAERKKSQATARKQAAKIWESAAEATADHPYLVRKGVGRHGLKVDRGQLVVPMYDAAGVLQSLQFIAADGAKRFLTGGRKRDAFM